MGQPHGLVSNTGRNLSGPLLILHTLQLGSDKDVPVLLHYVGWDGVRQALQDATPGILDKRSWTFWHVMLREPVPLMPMRDVGDELTER